ncbi:MAG: cysteine desulfurase NifS [Candidatus Omnitrophota bacterium]
MKKIYFDNNATTKTSPKVLEAMKPYFCDIYGNASSVHASGREAKAAMEAAREKTATLIGAEDPKEIIFTSGGTESNNMAIKGAAWTNKEKGNHIITSSIEHLAVLGPCDSLKAQGFEITKVPVDKYGIVSLEALKKAITPKTILVTIMFANNEVGTIEPIKEIAEICKQNGILFHTDAVQAAGKIPVNAGALGVDMLSVSAHKFHGPKGIGALYLRKRTKITPLTQGGHHERNLRPGTENIPAIVGMGAACELIGQNLENKKEYLTKLRDTLYNRIAQSIDYISLNGHPQLRLPNTVNIGFEFLEGESIVLNLDLEGIAVSTGSACTSGTLEPSHVLSAMAVAPEKIQGSVRFSLSEENTTEDIDYVVKILPPIVKRLRAMSPLYADRIKRT